MNIAFVIPVYNRVENLRLVLRALQLQTDPFFSVIVADDGSTDNPAGVVNEFIGQLDIKLFSQEHKGYRVSKVRNMGVSHVSQLATHLWFVDSDVVLNPDAVVGAKLTIAVHPNVVIAGRYDWMPPMQISCEDLEDRWSEFVGAELPALPHPGNAQIGGREVVGQRRRFDVRQQVDWTARTITLCTGATLSGNLIVPKAAFDLVGGFDENIEGQGQDCDFGKMLGRAGVQMLFSETIMGYHLYHYRDLAFCSSSVQETIKYMAEKFA